MPNRIWAHIRKNVIGYVALFLALTGGTAYALTGHNTVFSDDIVDGQVKTADVKNDNLTAKDLANLAALQGQEVRCNDTTPGGGTADACFDITVSGFEIKGTCEDEGGGGVTSRIGISHPDSGMAVNSDAQNGVTDTTSVVGGVIKLLAVVGPTTAAHYQSGDYAATANDGGAIGPATTLTGEAVAGTNLQGADCVLGVTTLG